MEDYSELGAETRGLKHMLTKTRVGVNFPEDDWDVGGR